MGKRIISQARGHGGPRYRVKKKSFLYRIKYLPNEIEGEGNVVKLIHSAGHSAPIAKIQVKDKMFFNLAGDKTYEGQKIMIGNGVENGNIIRLENIPTKTNVYNIESRPSDGGKFIRSAGGFATIVKKEQGIVTLLMPSKKQKEFNGSCRATIGVIAGTGRNEKPILKAGKNFYIKGTKGGKLWPRTSAVKMNVIDHPFGSGRGKNLTHGGLGKIPRRNAPPGAKVGSIRAKQTGKRKS